MTERALVRAGAEVEINVEKHGSGVSIMLLHGFSGDISTMAQLTSRLSRVAEVVVPDLVGHGRSSVPHRTECYSVNAMVSHAVAISESQIAGSFHLVGYSMGGRVALTMACRHPHLLRSLTLIGASAGLASQSARKKRQAADLELADRIERLGLEWFVDHWMNNPLFATQSRLGADHLLQARKQRLANSTEGLARSLRAAGTGVMQPLHDELVNCAVPTLFIAGSEDPKFVGIANDLASLMPVASVAKIANAGHAAHIEQPDEVAAAILQHAGIGS